MNPQERPNDLKRLIKSESIKENHIDQPPSSEQIGKQVSRSVENTSEQLDKVRHEINIAEQNQPSDQKEIAVPQNQRETITIGNKQYIVEYVPKDAIYPGFGNSSGNIATVRKDLPPRVRNFVKAHELYHCQDEATWGGWIGREIRANLVPGLKDPAGLLATAWATLSDLDRIKFYLRRIKRGY
ncbi:MAG: hypothetical protein ABI430_02335 [Candidatus Taylorbacteria bacterium]